MFMNRDSIQLSCSIWLAAALLAVPGSLSNSTSAAESMTTSTNQPSASLDTLVAEVLEHNPELTFYRAEIAAAKGERRIAGTWPNPEVSTTLGQKQVRGDGRGVGAHGFTFAGSRGVAAGSGD